MSRRPDAIPALEGLGVLAYQSGRAGEAADLFERGVVIRPEAASFHANLGEALRIMRRSDAAEGHLRRALALDPALPGAWNSRGLLAQDRGRHAEAAEAGREAIRLGPGFASAYIDLGNALQECGARTTRPRRCAPPCGSSPRAPSR